MINENVNVWLDVSMKRFEYVHPAGGNEFTSVKLTPEELEKASDAVGWCDVCKGWKKMCRYGNMVKMIPLYTLLVQKVLVTEVHLLQ